METESESGYVTKPWPSTLGLQRPATRPAGYPLPHLFSLRHTFNQLGTAHCRLLQVVFPDFSAPITTSFHSFCPFTQQDMSGLGPANPYLPTAPSDWQCLPAVLSCLRTQ